jgi:peptidoglycan/LPS O-acetylase OafA/YrhL
MGHIRGLDGIRALSLLAIVAFHTGLNSVPGGFYGWTRSSSCRAS